MTIGVMDSGIGGLTTLNTLMKVCGGNYVFLRDSVSYGDKTDDFVARRTFKACERLKASGARIIVLACNTATAVAIEKLRKADCGFNYIGVEPAVKPALKACSRVAVALTPLAARQEKFLRLIEGDRDRIKLITPPLLAADVEKNYFDRRAELSARILLEECEGCDGLVLGCTHYIFLKEHLRTLRPELKIFDGNEGVACRLYRFTGHMGPASVEFAKMY